MLPGEQKWKGSGEQKWKVPGGVSVGVERIIVVAMDNDIPIRGRAIAPGYRGAWGHAPSLHADSVIIHGQHNSGRLVEAVGAVGDALLAPEPYPQPRPLGGLGPLGSNVRPSPRNGICAKSRQRLVHSDPH